MGDESIPPPGRAPRGPDDLVTTALRAGAACGGIGFLFGGTAGILKNTTPFLFAAVAGLQTFTLGSTFFVGRSIILRLWTPEQQQPTPANLIKASTMSGAISGGVVAMVTRGRRNAVPGAIMFALFGCLGQTAMNAYATQGEHRPAESAQSFWKRMGEKKWSPFTVMTDEEYVDLLKERLFKVDVEIALVDDKIAALRRQQSIDEPVQP